MSDEVDESHQHAILTPADLETIAAEALKIRAAIDEDRENPLAVDLLEAAGYNRQQNVAQILNAMQDAYLALAKRLDVYALAVLQLNAAAAELAEMGGGGSAREKLATVGLREILNEARRPRVLGAFDNLKGSPPKAPAANEVLPPERRASWARKKTPHDS